MKNIDFINGDLHVGQKVSGIVKNITKYGAFVDIGGGKEGLVHISKIAKERVNKVEDYVKPGDKVPVKVIEIDDQGRINLTMKDLVDLSKENILEEEIKGYEMLNEANENLIESYEKLNESNEKINEQNEEIIKIQRETINLYKCDN